MIREPDLQGRISTTGTNLRLRISASSNFSGIPVARLRARNVFGQSRTLELRNSARLVQSLGFQCMQLTR